MRHSALVLLALALLGVVGAGCGGGTETRSATGTPSASETSADKERGELVVSGSEPVAFAIAPDGRMFYTQAP